MTNPKPTQFTPKGRVKNITASITVPEQSGLRIIINFVSQNGKFDTELDQKLAKRWIKIREEYRAWIGEPSTFKLGNIKTSTLDSETWAVQGIIFDKDDALSYDALVGVVKKLGDLAVYEKGSLHIHSSLIKEYPVLVDLVNEHVVERGISVYYYNDPQR